MAMQRPAPTFGDRIRWFGWLSWMSLGIIALVATLFVLGYLVLFRSPVSTLIAPVGVAAVVVYLLNPVVSWLERRGVRRGLGVSAVYLVFLAVVGVALRFLIPVIVDQVSGFIDEVPGYVRTISTKIEEIGERFGYTIDISSEQLAETITENRDTILSVLGGVRSVAGQVLHGLVMFLIGAILSIYLLLDLPKIQRSVTNAIPEDRRDEVLGVMDKVGQALGGFFRGQLLVAAFVGVATAIGLTLIGLPFAVLIGIVAGVFNLVPLIGPFLAAIPAVLLGLLSGTPSKAVWAAIVLLVVQQIDNHIVSPNVMGRTVQLHPATVMLALLAGATVAGILGMLIVIPAVAAAKIVFQHLWTKRSAIGFRGPPPVETPPA